MNITRSRWFKAVRQPQRIAEVARCFRTVRNNQLALSRAYITASGIEYPYTVVLRDGRALPLHDFYDLTTFWLIFMTETYVIGSADRVIIDAGANIGAFTLYAAPQPGSRIIAIEPFPPTFARLQATVTANRLSNVQCVNAALGAEEGLAYMGTIDEPSQFRALTESGEQAVRVTTLQTIFDQNNVDEVDLLKIDIEGGEYKSLLTADIPTLRRIRRIALEYHPGPKQDLFDHLSKVFSCELDRPDGNGYGIAAFHRR